MISILSKYLIPNRENTADPIVRKAYGSLCGFIGILLNLMLFGGKYLAGLLAGSVAITADAFNNLGDAGSSIVTLLGIHMANKRPDPDHPFGHGRIEYMSGVVVSVMIIVVAIELAGDSIARIRVPSPLDVSLLSMGILVASILVKLYMFLYNRSIGRKINAPAMLATATDSLSDCVTTSVVLLSMAAARIFHINIDGWCGLGVALFILYAGIKSTFETISPLLGSPPDPDFVEQVETIVLSYDEILNIHDLVVHDYGPGRCMVTLHAEVPSDGDFCTLHDAVDSAELELREQLGCEATIHMDPVSVNDEKVAAMRLQTALFASELGEGISIHDFRIVDGPTHTNVIFDAVLPYDVPLSPDALKAQLTDFIAAWPHHNAVITIDRPYHRS